MSASHVPSTFTRAPYQLLWWTSHLPLHSLGRQGGQVGKLRDEPPGKAAVVTRQLHHGDVQHFKVGEPEQHLLSDGVVGDIELGQCRIAGGANSHHLRAIHIASHVSGSNAPTLRLQPGAPHRVGKWEHHQYASCATSGASAGIALGWGISSPHALG